ncbi:tRNA pseudouridine synthase 1 [Steccherinum ochraceum]|uniref:tRNA pseudouridine synthase 1 n=1 Tax=Steccherinum ochraceum TaxID=92696 RepID=A0A4R0RPC4_9APHY|nr:tRNA pseudouridine synthase 1 [Steccherinum ochraceum]
MEIKPGEGSSSQLSPSSLGKHTLEDNKTYSSSKRVPPPEGISGEAEAGGQHTTAVDSTDAPLPEEKATDAPKKKPAKKGAGKSRKAWKAENRDSRRGTRREKPVEEGVEGDEQAKTERLPKRMCALLIGFCGEGYNGMQIQPAAKTIENTLFDALVRVGAVSQDNADDPVKVKINRAARTDAGVHAAGNLVSLKLIIDIPGVPDLVARVNEELPPEIRVWSYVRTRNSFQARSACDSRKYTYFFPSYLLLPAKPNSGMHKNTVPSDPSESAAVHPFWAETPSDSTPADDLRRKRQWRAGPGDVAKFREFAKKFEGTHNFHNFTVGQDFKDKSCIRFMRSIEVADPVVYGETEWVSVLLHGQSFMLHQIVRKPASCTQRKMICVMILACRSNTPLHLIEELFGPRRILAPKMPALGLLLEYPIFDSYNRKIAADNEKMSPTDPNFRQPIDFEAHREAIEQFKQEWIYTRVRATEQPVPIFDEWIRSIDKYAGKDMTYLGPRGVIPPEAVMTPGVRRENPLREKRKFDAVKFVEGEVAAEADEEAEASDEEGQGLGKAELAEMEG